MLIIHPTLAPYRLNFFNALAERCRLRLVLLIRSHPRQNFEQILLEKQLKAEYAHLDRGISVMGRIFRFGIGQEIRQFRPDVVVTQEFSPASLTVALYRSLRENSFRHIVWTDDNPESAKSDTIFRRLMRRVLLPRINALICLHIETARLYQNQFRANIPIGISAILHNEPDFRSALTNITPAAKALALKYDLEGKRILLFVGRLASEKRVERLIAAFNRILDAFPDSCLVLVGDGPQRAHLQKVAQELGIGEFVIFTGRAVGESLYSWYRLGELFVLPSEFEPFGAVVNEALLAGIPVVCSNKAGARVLVEDGMNGTVVDASDPTKLESALYSWLQRTPPLNIEQLEHQRPSLMRTSFHNSLEGFFSVMNDNNYVNFPSS